MPQRHPCRRLPHLARTRPLRPQGREGDPHPRPVRYRHNDSEKTGEDEPKEQLVGFKLAAVFDLCQTEPLPGVDPPPLDPPGQPVSGDSHAHLLAPLQRHAAALGYTLSYQPLSGRAGYCSARQARIVIDSELPANAKVATLVHELAHAHGIDYQRFSRAEAELIVESVACIVCAGAGLDTSADSIPYLAGWNLDQAAEHITLLAATIDEIARRIEHALDTPSAGADQHPRAPVSPPA